MIWPVHSFFLVSKGEETQKSIQVKNAFGKKNKRDIIFLDFCLYDLCGSRGFGFVGFCQRRDHFLFNMVCVSLMDELTENKA